MIDKADAMWVDFLDVESVFFPSLFQLFTTLPIHSMANNSRFSHPFTYSQPALTSKASTTNYSNPAISNNLTPNAGAWNASGTSTSVTGSQGTASNIPKRIRSTSPEPSREGSDESKRRQAKLNSNDADRDDSSDDEPKAYVNPHQNVLDLPHAFYVDQAIMSEEDRLVVIRFGDHRDPDCQRQDEVLGRPPPLF